MDDRFYGKKETYGLWYELYKTALLGMNIGLGGNIHSSGEENVCAFLVKRGNVETIFDVGANTGEYTRMLGSYFPDARIHCFEPAGAMFSILADNMRDNGNVVLNNFGISDERGKGVLYYDMETSGLASLYKRQLDYFKIDFSKSEKVQIETLDGYCEKNHIEKIDFLKLDIEGNEWNALQGGQKLLGKGCIGAIQIEFGGCNIDSRTYFRDFWNLLHEDYSAYRILKDGLWEITNYTERLECFCNTNYFFAHKNPE